MVCKEGMRKNCGPAVYSSPFDNIRFKVVSYRTRLVASSITQLIRGSQVTKP